MFLFSSFCFLSFFVFLSHNNNNNSNNLAGEYSPYSENHFDLSTFEFCDALCLRYLKPLLNVPPKCDGCGDPFTTSHALDCRRGGLVVQRHNEIPNLVSDLSSLVWSQVVKEPLFEDDSLHHVGLRADVGIRGACDIWVLDSDAPSYQSTPPTRVL